MGLPLVVKDHPQTSIPDSFDLIRTIKKYDNCYYADRHLDTFSLIEKSDLVFATSSNTSVESLLMMKKIILFGEKNYFFSTSSAPITRVTNIETLKSIIDSTLSTETDRESIYTLIYAMLTTTHAMVGNDNDWINIPGKFSVPRVDLYKRVADVIVAQLRQLDKQ